MAKEKHGLHKKVSSIFDGIDVPKPGGSQPEEEIPDQKAIPQVPKVGEPKSGYAPTKVPDKEKPEKAGETTPSIIQKSVKQKIVKKPVKRSSYKLTAPIPGVSGKKEKLKIATIPILFIVLVMVLISVFKTDTGTKEDKAEEVAKRQTEIALIESRRTEAEKVSWAAPNVYPARMPDPMKKNRPRFTRGRREIDVAIEEGDTVYDAIEIKSILYSYDSPSIVIGDDILYEGDKVLGVVISKINKENVEFEKEGIKFTKKLMKKSE